MQNCRPRSWIKLLVQCLLPSVLILPSAEAHIGCQCAQIAANCCGTGGGISHIAGYYGLHPIAPLMNGIPGVSLSGYEGLWDMDGESINHRYPYHSYRRPWFHPGPRAINISIVW